MAKIDFTRERTYGKSFDGVLKIQGHVLSEENLPLSAENGDIYSVGEDNVLYIFNGEWKTVAGGGSGGGATTPMIVHGGLEPREGGGGVMFVPDNGQPTFSEAAEAFESGIPVKLAVDINEGESTLSVNVLGHASTSEGALLYTVFTDGSMFWINAESPDPDPDPEPEPDPGLDPVK